MTKWSPLIIASRYCQRVTPHVLLPFPAVRRRGAGEVGWDNRVGGVAVVIGQRPSLLIVASSVNQSADSCR